MKKRFIKTLFFLSLTLLSGIPMTSCDKNNNSKEPDNPTLTTLILSATELQFNAKGDEQQTVNIQTDGSWNARVDADWIDISPRTGMLNGSITLTVNSPNETSRERVDTVYVTAGERMETICVKQKAMLTADCNVIPKNLVTLAYGIAFDIDLGANVTYFQFEVMETRQVSRMTDSELVAILDDSHRYNETVNVFYRSGGYYDPNSTNRFGISPETDYTILTVAHDNKGNRGDLIKTPVRTPSINNQPIAWISNLEWYQNSGKWTWKTTINAYVKQYYQLFVTEASESEINNWNILTAAFHINYYVHEEPGRLTPAIQNGSWTLTPSKKPYIKVYSWAQNQNGEWAGDLDYMGGIIPGYSSSPFKTMMQSNIKPECEQCRLLKNIDFEIRRIK